MCVTSRGISLPDLPLAFLRTDYFIRLIEEELYRYHQLEVTCRDNLARYCDELNSCITKLSPSVNLIQEIDMLINMASRDWYKIYICDFRGFQQTPNYVQKSPGQWEVHEEYLSRNWCWRPYFLPYVTDSIRYQRGVLFRPRYTDVDTQQKKYGRLSTLLNDKPFFCFIDSKIPICLMLHYLRTLEIVYRFFWARVVWESKFAR